MILLDNLSDIIRGEGKRQAIMIIRNNVLNQVSIKFYHFLINDNAHKVAIGLGSLSILCWLKIVLFHFESIDLSCVCVCDWQRKTAINTRWLHKSVKPDIYFNDTNIRIIINTIKIPQSTALTVRKVYAQQI